MFRPTLDRKRKSTTGILVIVVVGLLFYFHCSICESGGKVVPDHTITSTGHRIRDAASAAINPLPQRRSPAAVAPLVVRLRQGRTPQELDVIKKNGYLPFDSGDLVNQMVWYDFSKNQDKVSKDRTKESRSSRVVGSRSRSKTKEPRSQTGDSSEHSTLVRSSEPASMSSKSETLSARTSTGRHKESMSDGVRMGSNSIPLESDAHQFRSNISKSNSGPGQGLDDGRPWSRTASSSPSKMKDKFRFPIDVSGACDRRTLVLIIVCSAWENAYRREVIRATWASLEDRQLRVLFIVGLPKQEDSQTEVHQQALGQESSTHGDLLQADFIDSYANLSLKSVAMLQWTEASCQPARFLVKADDDVLVNTPLLLRDLALTRHRRFVMGNVMAGARPSRDTSSKWFTPPAAYPQDFYPKYISGAAYVISGDLVQDLHAAALRAEVFWIEDVFITGLLLASGGGSDVINAQHIYNGKFDIQKEFNDVCALKRHILRHLSDPTEMNALWSVITSSSVCVTST